MSDKDEEDRKRDEEHRTQDIDLPRPSVMSSPAPMLRPPIPGTRSGGPKTPRLGLAIPASPSVKPVNNATQPQGRPALPQLRLATPMGSSLTPQENSMQNGSGRPPAISGQSAITSIDDGHGRSGSFTGLDGRASNPASAASQISALSFAMGLRQPQASDPTSAGGSIHSDRHSSDGGAGMERDGSTNGLPDLDKLSLDKGRPLDVEDLDDEGWRAASLEKKVIELGSLGEGAGGAVTRCILKGGKTVFALKVSRVIQRRDLN
jgi:mitogen-activated protein kinase kinase